MSLAGRADVIDEFADVFVSRAIRREIDALPAGIELAASDSPDRWVIGSDWSFTHTTDAVPGAGGPGPDSAPDARAARLTAALGDLVLFVWGRAEPWNLPDRFAIDGDEAVLRAFQSAPVHI